jgi:hypothetical protein
VRGVVDTIIEQQVWKKKQFPSSNQPFDELGQLISYLSTLSSLSRLCRGFHQSTMSPTRVQRIQAGSPGAGQLGPVVKCYRDEFFKIVDQCRIIFIMYSQLPGVGLLQMRLKELQETLGMNFNDTSSGYGERVLFLEKLNSTIKMAQ